MSCPNCGTEIAPHVTRCHVCQTDVGFPNVRAANLPAAKDALANRLADAYRSANARGCASVLDDFGNAVTKSHAIVCRPLGVVKNVVDSGKDLIVSFYSQVEAGSRMPEQNRFDRGRPSVDGVMFPYYSDKMCFAVLSLDESGIGGTYGGCHMSLKDAAIANRTTVFEENSFHFCTAKQRIIVGGEVPPGYRATWSDRHRLAQAKHAPDISARTQPSDYAGILLRPATRSEDEVFVEVHIYGPIHRQAIAGIAAKRPPKGPDLVLWNSLRKMADKSGIQFTELP